MENKIIHMTRGPFGTIKCQDRMIHIERPPVELWSCDNLRVAKRIARENGYTTILFCENMGARRPGERIINLV